MRPDMECQHQHVSEMSFRKNHRRDSDSTAKTSIHCLQRHLGWNTHLQISRNSGWCTRWVRHAPRKTLLDFGDPVRDRLSEYQHHLSLKNATQKREKSDRHLRLFAAALEEYDTDRKGTWKMTVRHKWTSERLCNYLCGSFRHLLGNFWCEVISSTWKVRKWHLSQTCQFVLQHCRGER